MPRVHPISLEQASVAAQTLWQEQVSTNGRMTNMKRTLARSAVALDAYMRWYDLRDQVKEFLGARLTVLFALAISAETDCAICSTYFRRYFIESGDDPDNFELSEREQRFMEFGRQIARNQHRVDNETFKLIEAELKPEQVVELVAFAGVMVATNIINNVLEVQLDEDFEKYRKKVT